MASLSGMEAISTPETACLSRRGASAGLKMAPLPRRGATSSPETAAARAGRATYGASTGRHGRARLRLNLLNAPRGSLPPRRPFGIAIVGGLLVSQLLTLYTLVVYLYLDRFRLWLERRRVARVLRRRPAAESDALRVVGPALCRAPADG